MVRLRYGRGNEVEQFGKGKVGEIVMKRDSLVKVVVLVLVVMKRDSFVFCKLR